MKLALTLAITSTLVLAGCAAVTDQIADRREVEAETRFPPGGDLIDVGNGRNVHAFVTGEGPDLILIHGASGNTRDFTFRFTGRMGENYRTIVLDRPGLGWSDRADAAYEDPFNPNAETPREQARMLKAAADKLGVQNPIILGHSYGAAVALAWALEFPDHPAGLVIVSGATEPWPGELGALYRINGTALGGATLPPLVTAYAPRTLLPSIVERIFAPQAVPEGYRDYVGAGLSIRRSAIRANGRQVAQLKRDVTEMAPNYAAIDMPVEIVHGAEDPIVPPDIHALPLFLRIEGATLQILDGIGHMPHHVAPEAVEAAIDRAADRAGLR
ncbi:alpha/beta fold hydrolase [Aestuariibius sp. 2305UL40-4]|uniref:alpha/beta fold hydrolase n=1 Tax=Aestuariibius violaceus TaxID=3234132 RepID=UPI00345E499F